ncbi:MAG: hypothetical protein AMJ70_01405 [Dehalococcoidia bacterium SG8_51_3]|nr:MAG: hypothetical protein AMJ70_01405 [Dehalococcoidia bacterium SG8_51_3]
MIMQHLFRSFFQSFTCSISSTSPADESPLIYLGYALFGYMDDRPATSLNPCTTAIDSPLIPTSDLTQLAI